MVHLWLHIQLRFPKSHMCECSLLKARRAGDGFGHQNVLSIREKFYRAQLATVISFSSPQMIGI